MQDKADNSKEKQEKGVQILSAKRRTKTLHKGSNKPSRSKYKCNPKLAELIKLANILPANFNFDWNLEISKSGFEVAFEKWKKVFFDLSINEQLELVGADFGKNYIVYPSKLPEELKKRDEFGFCLRAVDNSQEIIKIRNFLKRAIVLYKISQEKEIKVFIKKGEEAFDAFNKLYSDIEPLYKFIACWKVAEQLKYIGLVNEKYRNSILVYLTARYILLEEHKDFDISDKEATKFLQKWKTLFLINDLETESTDRLFIILDLLAKTALNYEIQIPDVSLSVDREGNVEFQFSEYVKAIQGVNISRLRFCEYCKKLFWANRKDSYACSKKHARNRRMRLLRKNWKENGDLYLNARKKKAKKKKENKENGSL
jgi:hypothetical protein